MIDSALAAELAACPYCFTGRGERAVRSCRRHGYLYVPKPVKRRPKPAARSPPVSAR